VHPQLAVDHGLGVATRPGRSALVPEGHGTVAEEADQLGLVTPARGHHLACGEGSQLGGVADVAHHVQTGGHGGHVVGVGEEPRVDVHRVVRSRPGAPHPPAALRVQQPGEQGPGVGWQVVACGVLGARERDVEGEGEHVGGVQRRRGPPEGDALAEPGDRRQRLRRLPVGEEPGVVLEVAADAGQVCDDRDAEAGQLGLVADPRLHQHLGRVDRAQAQDDLREHPDAAGLGAQGELHAGGRPATRP
jgi:hypothetical protein